MIARTPHTSLLHRVLLGLFLLAPHYAYAEQQHVKFDDCHITLGPKVAKVHAGYCKISNPSARPLVFTQVTSAAYGRVELHLSEVKDGIASMRQIKKLIVGAGETVVLKPEGLHLMLMHPKQKLEPESKVQFEFTTGNGDIISTTLHAVRNHGGAKGSHAGHASSKGSHSGNSHKMQ